VKRSDILNVMTIRQLFRLCRIACSLNITLLALKHSRFMNS